MKKPLILTLLILCYQTQGLTASDNLNLENPNFEQPWSGLSDFGSPITILKKVASISTDVTGWRGDVGNGNLTIYQGPGYIGNHSAVLVNTHTTGGARFYNNNVLTLTKGSTYKLTFYARGNATLVNVSLFQADKRPKISEVQGPSADGVYDPSKTPNSSISLGNTWTKMEYHFTVPISSSYTDYKLYFAFYASPNPLLDGSNLNDVFMIDDVVLKAVELPNQQDTTLAVIGELSEEMLGKALNFRSAIRANDGFRSGVYVYNNKSITTYLNNPAKLAARIAILGIKDVYLSATSASLTGTDTLRYEWNRDFNEAAHGFGLKVWALRLANYNHFVNNNLIIQDCAKVLGFNNEVASNQRFDAVSADWEPHVLKAGGANTPPELTYFWDSNNNFGVGNSNDLLLQRTHEMLALAKTNLNGLSLNEAIHYMYQNYFNQGQLSYGSTLQFLQDCEYVTVMSYVNTKEKVWQRGLPVVESAPNHPASVNICVKTSLNTYGDGGDASTSLHSKGWSYLIEAMHYLYSQGSLKQTFRGIDFFEFEGLEIMWNEQIIYVKANSYPNIKDLQREKIISYNDKTASLIIDIPKEEAKLEIYSIMGKLVLTQNVTDNKVINLNYVPTGNYIVKLFFYSHQPIQYKFVKK